MEKVRVFNFGCTLVFIYQIYLHYHFGEHSGLETEGANVFLQRVVPPAFAAHEAQLPVIDFIIISHNHYDHLDLNSVSCATATIFHACKM